MDSPFSRLAYEIGRWLLRHQIDTDKVRVVLSFPDAGEMAKAEWAIKANEMWRMQPFPDIDQPRCHFKVGGVDIRLESRKDK